MKSSAKNPLQCRDTTLALTFLLLLIWFFTRNLYWVYGAMALLVFGMIWPAAMTFPARLWFGLSHVLGQVMSRVLLGVIYTVLVLPVALARRLMGKDPLRLHQWKEGASSAFVTREHIFTKDDLRNPY